jgi:hypothetical protein
MVCALASLPEHVRRWLPLTRLRLLFWLRLHVQCHTPLIRSSLASQRRGHPTPNGKESRLVIVTKRRIVLLTGCCQNECSRRSVLTPKQANLVNQIQSSISTIPFALDVSRNTGRRRERIVLSYVACRGLADRVTGRESVQRCGHHLQEPTMPWSWSQRSPDCVTETVK